MKDFNDYWLSLSTRDRRAYSKRTGVSLNSMSQIAHGHRRPSWGTVQRLAHGASNVTFSMFFDNNSFIEDETAEIAKIAA